MKYRKNHITNNHNNYNFSLVLYKNIFIFLFYYLFLTVWYRIQTFLSSYYFHSKATFLHCRKSYFQTPLWIFFPTVTAKKKVSFIIWINRNQYLESLVIYNDISKKLLCKNPLKKWKKECVYFSRNLQDHIPLQWVPLDHSLNDPAQPHDRIKLILLSFIFLTFLYYFCISYS